MRSFGSDTSTLAPAFGIQAQAPAKKWLVSGTVSLGRAVTKADVDIPGSVNGTRAGSL